MTWIFHCENQLHYLLNKQSRGFLKTMLNIAINLKIWSMIDWYDPEHFFCISSESVLCRSYSVEETRGSLSRQKQKKRPPYHLSAGANTVLSFITTYITYLYHSIICQQEQHGLSFITTYITYLYHRIICQPEQHGLPLLHNHLYHLLISQYHLSAGANTVSPS